MSDDSATTADELAPRKLTHEEARQEQRLYWSGKSMSERLAGMAELTKRLYRMRGIDLDESKADFTPSRVRRSRIETGIEDLADAEELTLLAYPKRP